MMKNMIFLKYAVASLFMLSFSQSSWSMDKEPEIPIEEGGKRRTQKPVIPAPVLSAPPADEVDPALMEQARQAVKLAEKRLGLNKSPKIGIKAAK